MTLSREGTDPMSGEVMFHLDDAQLSARPSGDEFFLTEEFPPSLIWIAT